MTAAEQRDAVTEALLPALAVRTVRETVARRLRDFQEAEGPALREHAERLYDLLLHETSQPELLDFLRINQARHALWECLRQWPATEDEVPQCAV